MRDDFVTKGVDRHHSRWGNQRNHGRPFGMQRLRIPTLVREVIVYQYQKHQKGASPSDRQHELGPSPLPLETKHLEDFGKVDCVDESYMRFAQQSSSQPQPKQQLIRKTVPFYAESQKYFPLFEDNNNKKPTMNSKLVERLTF